MLGQQQSSGLQGQGQNPRVPEVEEGVGVGDVCVFTLSDIKAKLDLRDT